MSFSGYQIRADVLSSMRRAAGDYMPEYGNWRYKLNHPKPEDPDDGGGDSGGGEEDDKGNVPIEGSGTTVVPAQEEITEEVEVEGEALPTYKEAWEQNAEGIQQVYENYQAYVDDMEGIEEGDDRDKERETERDRRGQTHMETQVVQEAVEGGESDWSFKGYFDPDHQLHVDSMTGDIPQSFWDEHDLDPNDPAIAQAYGLDQGSEDVAMKYRERSPLQSSPYKKGVASPYAKKQLYDGVDRFLDSQVNKLQVNGSIATKALHKHIENIAGDIKNNLYFKPANNKKEEKANRAAASKVQQEIANSTKAALSKDGSLDIFHQNYKENLVSESMTDQEKYIMAHMLQPGPEIVPRVNENNHVAYMVPMPEGYQFPVTNQWLSETIAKRTKPFTAAQNFVESKVQFFEAGRSGQPFDHNSVMQRNIRMIDSNPDKLAAFLLDRGLFHPQPFLDLMLDAEDANEESPFNYSEGELDRKRFVIQALGDKETRKQFENKFATGLTHEAYNSWNRGKAIHDQENTQKTKNATANMSIEEKYNFYKNKSQA